MDFLTLIRDLGLPTAGCASLAYYMYLKDKESRLDRLEEKRQDREDMKLLHEQLSNMNTTNIHLVESNKALVESNRKIVDTNQILADKVELKLDTMDKKLDSVVLQVKEV